MTENQCNKCLAAISKPTSCSSSDAPPVAVVYYACDKCSLAALGSATRAKLETTVGGKYSVCYVHASKCEFPALSLSKLLCFVLQVKPSVMSTTVKYFAHMRRRPLSPRQPWSPRNPPQAQASFLLSSHVRLRLRGYLRFTNSGRGVHYTVCCV